VPTGSPDRKYIDHVVDAASVASFHRGDNNGLLSAEAIPENSSLLDFKTFAHDYPERLFPLLEQLRPEMMEIFVEYYLLGKSQSFLAQCRAQIQTRIWQSLRIVEQAVGALIVLGANPDRSVLLPIISGASLEPTPFGSLTNLVLLYAKTHSYKMVAREVGAPVPMIRKIFRPAIAALIKSRNLNTAAVGCYIRSLIHQASLTGTGLSKSCLARMRRVKHMHFDAPPSDSEMLMSFGNVASLKETPWSMFEISSEHRMNQIFPNMRKHGVRTLSKKAAQIFAPMDANDELEFGYILARASTPGLTRSLTRIRGISEMAALYSDDGSVRSVITVPHADVAKLIKSHSKQKTSHARMGDFVEILTGEANHYCGEVVQAEGSDLVVSINFPSGRRFTVTADISAVKLLNVSPNHRAFWGKKDLATVEAPE
jgi:hypothetical protein